MTTVDICNFCGKTKSEVKKLIVANEVGESAICDECVVLCMEIVDMEKATLANPDDKTLLDPMEIRQHLDRDVIGQERAKVALSIGVANHYRRIDFPPKDDLVVNKSNILLIGPTGNGKTELARSIATYLDLPFAITDATTLTEAGYVGDDVENIITRLLVAADYDTKKAERGIIFIDEIDKIGRKSESASITRDVSGEGVQQALLKLIEGTMCNVIPHQQSGRKHPSQETVSIDTSNILFICGGAFVGLDRIIRDRTSKSSIGFGAMVVDNSNPDPEILAQTRPKDLIKFGLIPELVGRLPVVTSVLQLTIDQMVQVLTEPRNNLVRQQQYLFSLSGIHLKFTDSALAAIAKKAKELEVGARGLQSILEETLQPHQYNAMQYYRDGVRELIVNKNTVMHNDKVKLVYAESVVNEKP